MNLQQLRYLVALNQHKHFGKAADSCYISQPSLSIAIKKLEDELGQPLFERLGAEVRPTELGKTLGQKAQNILDQVSEFTFLASKDNDLLKSKIKLGAIFTVAPYLFPKVITKIHKLAPKLQLELQENFTESFREQLKTGEVDAVVLSEPFKEPGIVTKFLYDESFVALLPKGHKLCKLKHIQPKHLKGEKVLMLGPGHCFRDQVLATCPDAIPGGIDEQDTNMQIINFSSATLDTIRNMVATNLGITVLPESAAHLPNYLKSVLEVRPYGDRKAKRRIVLAWRASYPNQSVLDLLLQTL